MQKDNLRMLEVLYMVLPLVDECKPKCHLCHAGFGDIYQLRVHLKTAHAEEYSGSDEKPLPREPAPGDVTVF